MGIDLFNALDFEIVAHDGEPVITLQNKPHPNGKPVTFEGTVD